MTLDPRTPVLVGAAAVQQHCEDPGEALEPTGLMAGALERAAQVAGNRELLTQANSIRIPRGFWDYPNPCSIVAEQIGAKYARSVVAEVGILQSTLFGSAGRDIAEGRTDIVLITGAEAKYRTLRAQILGREAPLTAQGDVVQADEVLRPHGDIITPLEIQRYLAMPVNQYSIVENATRAADGMSLLAHRQEVARMWAGFSEVAASNPNAWDREAHGADEIANPGPRNRMLAYPYSKLHNSQWNVDQAAGLILCSVEAARRFAVLRHANAPFASETEGGVPPCRGDPTLDSRSRSY
jgi:acetyl-CoA C-acetyltransferase